MRKTTAGIVFLMLLTLMCGAALAQTRVLATTFPVYQIVRNITQNVPDVEVQLMKPSSVPLRHGPKRNFIPSTAPRASPGCSRIRTRKRRTRSMRGTIMGG